MSDFIKTHEINCDSFKVALLKSSKQLRFILSIKTCCCLLGNVRGHCLSISNPLLSILCNKHLGLLISDQHLQEVNKT